MKKESLEPIEGAQRGPRRRLDLRGELLLAALPTLTMLAVLLLVEIFARQRVLFGSLASSAFLIYLDPQHGANRVRSLVLSHTLAASAGLATYLAFGHGYGAAAAAMAATILLLIVLDVVHPPAVATSLIFAFRSGAEQTVVLFGLALAMMAVLVVLERYMLWALARFDRHRAD